MMEVSLNKFYESNEIILGLQLLVERKKAPKDMMNIVLISSGIGLLTCEERSFFLFAKCLSVFSIRS